RARRRGGRIDGEARAGRPARRLRTARRAGRCRRARVSGAPRDWDARRRRLAHASPRGLMLRLYLPGVRASDELVHIAGPELRHLRTLRLAPGVRLRVLDDTGGEHDVVLERAGAREAVGRIVASAWPARESPLDLVLAPALLKGTKMDL